MSMNGMKRTMLGAGLISVASLAIAQEEVKGPKLSSEVRAAWRTTDNGLDKVDGYDPVRTSNFGVERLKLQLKGDLDESTDYRFRLDFSGAAAKVEYAYATWWVNKMIGVRLGLDKVQQGGIYNMTNGLYDLAKPIYAKAMPHDTYKPMLAVDVKVAGTVSVQLMDDVGSKVAKWHTVDQQPAVVVSYVGDFNGILPRVQVGSYDNNHSQYFSVGSAFKLAGAKAFVNYTMDNRSHKDSATAVDPKDKVDVLTSVELDAKYAVTKEIEPFLHVSMYDRVQEGTDKEINSITVSGTEQTLNWDDNGTVIGIGAFYNATAHASPFIGIDIQSGDFAENLDSTSTKVATQTEVAARLGMAAQF